MKYTLVLISAILILAAAAGAQQRADMEFTYRVENPAYPERKGPLVLLDEGHENFHRLDHRYRPFSKLLRSDGYVLQSATGTITKGLLSKCAVFAISVPTNAEHKSAYTPEEIMTLRKWVEDGGSLLLITDHMPDPPAIAGLTGAFGITLRVRSERDARRGRGADHL